EPHRRDAVARRGAVRLVREVARGPAVAADTVDVDRELRLGRARVVRDADDVQPAIADAIGAGHEVVAGPLASLEIPRVEREAARARRGVAAVQAERPLVVAALALAEPEIGRAHV